jgi:hypothetical protein
MPGRKATSNKNPGEPPSKGTGSPVIGTRASPRRKQNSPPSPVTVPVAPSRTSTRLALKKASPAKVTQGFTAESPKEKINFNDDENVASTGGDMVVSSSVQGTDPTIPGDSIIPNDSGNSNAVSGSATNTDVINTADASVGSTTGVRVVGTAMGEVDSTSDVQVVVATTGDGDAGELATATAGSSADVGVVATTMGEGENGVVGATTGVGDVGTTIPVDGVPFSPTLEVSTTGNESVVTAIGGGVLGTHVDDLIADSLGTSALSIANESESNIVITMEGPLTEELIDSWKEKYGEQEANVRSFFTSQELNRERAWFTVPRPTVKQYPTSGPSSISHTSYAVDVDAWLVRTELSSRVRLFFPGLEEFTHSCFLNMIKCTDPIMSHREGIYVHDNMTVILFRALQSIHKAKPKKKNAEDPEPNNFLSQLMNSSLPKDKKGKDTTILFRNTFRTPGRLDRVLVVFFKMPRQGEILKKASLFTKNADKMKQFFSSAGNCEADYSFTPAESERFRALCIRGESLSITVLSENGLTDTIIASVQFKRTIHGAWINYLSTSCKGAGAGPFGVRSEFLPVDTPFRGMGLSFTLLRSVQALLCFNGQPPALFVRAKIGTSLFEYFQKRGFKVASSHTVPGMESIKSPHLARLEED